jgi:hypothetical protein
MPTERRTALTVWRIASAVFLLATGIIHIVLVITGTGGLLGVMFILNGIAGVVLGVAVLVLRGRLLFLAIVLGLLFMIASVLALVLALTVTLFGIRETLSYAPVPPTLIVESIGIVVLAITTVVARGAASRRSPVAAE